MTKIYRSIDGLIQGQEQQTVQITELNQQFKKMDKFMQKFLIYMQGQTKTLTPIPENQNNPFSILAEDTEDEYEDEDKETDEADKEAEEELETEISNWASFQSRVHTEEKEYEEDDLFDEASNISSSFRQNNRQE